MSKICDSCVYLVKSKKRGRMYCEAETRDTSLHSCRDFKAKKYDRKELPVINRIVEREDG